MSDQDCGFSICYDVDIDQEQEYQINVGYDVPASQVQYSNLILDNISSQFDGISQTFPLTVNGEPYFPLNDQQLIISVDNVILSPGIDYQVSSSDIFFINAPSSGNEFFGVALATTADLTRTVNFVLDNGSFDIEPGSKGYLNIDVSGEIESWILVAETVGNIAIDIRKSTYDTFPDNFTSIVGTEYPLLINQDKNKDEDLTTWDTTLRPGDILDFNVLSCSGIQKCSVFLRLKL